MKATQTLNRKEANKGFASATTLYRMKTDKTIATDRLKALTKWIKTSASTILPEGSRDEKAFEGHGIFVDRKIQVEKVLTKNQYMAQYVNQGVFDVHVLLYSQPLRELFYHSEEDSSKLDLENIYITKAVINKVEYLLPCEMSVRSTLVSHACRDARDKTSGFPSMNLDQPVSFKLPPSNRLAEAVEVVSFSNPVSIWLNNHTTSPLHVTTFRKFLKPHEALEACRKHILMSNGMNGKTYVIAPATHPVCYCLANFPGETNTILSNATDDCADNDDIVIKVSLESWKRGAVFAIKLAEDLRPVNLSREEFVFSPNQTEMAAALLYTGCNEEEFFHVSMELEISCFVPYSRTETSLESPLFYVPENIKKYFIDWNTRREKYFKEVKD